MGKGASKDIEETAKLLSEKDARRFIKAAAKLQSQIQKQYPFIENLQEAACVADVRKQDQPLIYVNKHFQWMTLYDREDIVGRNCRFLQGKWTNPDTVKAIRNAISSGCPLDVEILNYRKDGLPFWNNFVLLPVFKKQGSTQLTHFLAVQKDVTLLKQGGKTLDQWGVEEVVFHLECIRIPEDILQILFTNKIDGNLLQNMNEDTLATLLGKVKSANFHIQRILTEVQYLLKDPEYFKASQVEWRRLSDLAPLSLASLGSTDCLQDSGKTLTPRTNIVKEVEIHYVSPGGSMEKVNFGYVPERKLFWDSSTGSELLKKETICLKLKYFPSDFNPNANDEVSQKLIIVNRAVTYPKLQKIVRSVLDGKEDLEIKFRSLKKTDVLTPEELIGFMQEESVIMLDLVVQVGLNRRSDSDVQKKVLNSIQLSMKLVSEMRRNDLLENTIINSPELLLRQIHRHPYSVQESLIRPLLRILSNHGRSNEFIRLALREEVEYSNDGATLFRESSLATLLFSEFHQMIAKNFLASLLQPLVDKISSTIEPIAESLNLKSDSASSLPAVLTSSSEKKIKKLLDYLRNITGFFLLDLFRSAAEIPEDLTNVYRDLYLQCKMKFPKGQLDQVNNTNMITFFFLRFLCPALMHPERYVRVPKSRNSSRESSFDRPSKTKSGSDILADSGTAEEQDDPRIIMLMKELSVIVQKICANSQFPVSSWKSGFNDLIAENQLPLQIFIAQVLQIPERNKQRTDDLTVLGMYLDLDSLIDESSSED